jgi:hypothetical protein
MNVVFENVEYRGFTLGSNPPASTTFGSVTADLKKPRSSMSYGAFLIA